MILERIVHFQYKTKIFITLVEVIIMRVISREHSIYSFNSAHPCCCTVQDGETFFVETYDCYRGQIIDASVKRTDIDLSVANSSTGPIFVESAMPDDTLCVEILAIELAPQGFMVVANHMGVLGDLITEPDTKVIPIKDGLAYFSDTLRLPLTPMIGVCGVAPKPGLDIHCKIPGDHGANMDTKVIRSGSRIYLPVFVPGALLAIGDLHACMGDGELSGTGIEISGRVCVKTTVFHNRSIKRPVVETSDALYFIASDNILYDAIRLATMDAVTFLQNRLVLSFIDAYRLLSATCDIQISQVVNAKHTARVCCPKFNTRIETF